MKVHSMLRHTTPRSTWSRRRSTNRILSSISRFFSSIIWLLISFCRHAERTQCCEMRVDSQHKAAQRCFVVVTWVEAQAAVSRRLRTPRTRPTAVAVLMAVVSANIVAMAKKFLREKKILAQNGSSPLRRLPSHVAGTGDCGISARRGAARKLGCARHPQVCRRGAARKLGCARHLQERSERSAAGAPTAIRGGGDTSVCCAAHSSGFAQCVRCRWCGWQSRRCIRAYLLPSSSLSHPRSAALAGARMAAVRDDVHPPSCVDALSWQLPDHADVQELFRYAYYVLCKAAERRLGMSLPARAVCVMWCLEHAHANSIRYSCTPCSCHQFAKALLPRRPLRYHRSGAGLRRQPGASFFRALP